MLLMAGLIITISTLLLVVIGIAVYKAFFRKKIIEHYYSPLDRVFGQTQVEYHAEKVEKKESEDDEGDDKDKNKGKNKANV